LTFCKEHADFFEPILDRWLAASASPIVDEAGCLLRLVHVVRDITDYKHAQETLAEAHHQELQRHRTELAHVARLSLMGEMTAGLVHELNQPLHAVKSYARGSALRLLKLPQADEELLASLQQIGEEADRAAEIIRRVRRFVQKRELHSSELFVNRLVEDVILLCKAEIDERRATVALELGENLPAVVADPIQIEQVVMNLVRNGLEAMTDTPDDDRRLTIKTMRYGNDAVEVEVSDQGRGIDPDHPERVFEPFYTTKPEGMGMGLAISRSIIQAYQGRLWVSLNQIRGCTFHFTLPVVTMP
jgi:C4-dicarboxylate-specific signal transduction histidine kinase